MSSNQHGITNAHYLDVRAVCHWRIWVRFSDGVEGEVDISYLKDSFARYQPLRNTEVFESVYVHPQGDIAWADNIELGTCGIHATLLCSTYNNKAGNCQCSRE